MDDGCDDLQRELANVTGLPCGYLPTLDTFVVLTSWPVLVAVMAAPGLFMLGNFVLGQCTVAQWIDGSFDGTNGAGCSQTDAAVLRQAAADSSDEGTSSDIGEIMARRQRSARRKGRAFLALSVVFVVWQYYCVQFVVLPWILQQHTDALATGTDAATARDPSQLGPLRTFFRPAAIASSALWRACMEVLLATPIAELSALCAAEGTTAEGAPTAALALGHQLVSIMMAAAYYTAALTRPRASPPLSLPAFPEDACHGRERERALMAYDTAMIAVLQSQAHDAFCPDCGCDVAHRDHHCVFVHNCVGRHNAVSFPLALILAIVGGCFLIAVSTPCTVALLDRPTVNPTSSGADVRATEEALIATVNTWLLSVGLLLTALVVTVAGALLAWHLHVTVRGTTTAAVLKEEAALRGMSKTS